MFTSHHKTGTNLGLELEACFVGSSLFTANFSSLAKRCKEQRTLSDLNWDGIVPDDCARVVHFVRTPRDIVRSAYLYHRRIPPVEPWLGFPASSILKEAVQDNPFLPGEPYNEYLARVPMAVGLYAEMQGSSSPISGQVLVDMEAASARSYYDPRVLTVCLEEGWSDFEGMVRRVANFLSLPYNYQLMSCVEKHNPSKHHFGAHTTTGSLTEAEMATLVGIIESHDKEWFHGKFGSSPLAGLCSQKTTPPKPSSESSRVQPSASYEWLDTAN